MHPAKRARLTDLMTRLAAAGVIASGLMGCRATPGYQGGQRTVVAKYQYRKLSADLPGSVRVPAVMAAARGALLDRGYAVQPGGRTDSASVTATSPDGGMLDKVTVWAKVAGSGTRVEIVVDPLGNQAESRAILDAMLARLGM